MTTFEEAKAASARAKKVGANKLSLADLHIGNAADLQNKTFAPLRWIVPERLPEGLSLLVGKPKVGKSWMALDIGAAVASGGRFLGRVCEQGDVLGLFLEDNERRLQRRLTSMLGAQKESWPARLNHVTEWPRLDDGGIELMREWVELARKPRLIVVDILERIRGRDTKSQQTQYSADYDALTSLHKLASETGVSVLVLHHQRKAGADDLMDTISGTGGIGGAADSLLVLGKDAAGNFLYGRGRDLEEFNDLVQQEAFRWKALGTKPDEQASTERSRIAAVMARGGSMTVAEIARAVPGLERTSVKNLLAKMHADGTVERVGRGSYRLPTKQMDMPI